jgi:hypothetical protein
MNIELHQDVNFPLPHSFISFVISTPLSKQSILYNINEQEITKIGLKLNFSKYSQNISRHFFLPNKTFVGFLKDWLHGLLLCRPNQLGSK